MGPAYEAFVVTETTNASGESKSYWTKVGAMWKLREKDGFTLNLNALPVGGKLVLLPPKPKQDTNSMPF